MIDKVLEELEEQATTSYDAYKKVKEYIEKKEAPKFLSGKYLLKYIDDPLLGQDAQVEGLIFKDSINIFYSEPGAGKTVIGINMLAAMSAGHRVFDYFHMKKPVRCSYLQLEGSKEENLGRLKEVAIEVPPDYENIAWHSNPIFVENRQSQIEMFKELLEFKPEVIFIDSFYCMTAQGLSKEDSFLKVRQLLQEMKVKTGATIIIFHHASKQQYDGLGNKIEKDDPFLGSQYLKAFADMMLHLKRTGENKVLMKVTKASRNNEGVKQITLKFNKVNWVVTAIPEETTKSAIGEIIDYLKKEFGKGVVEVDTNMIVKATGFTKRHIVRLKNDGHFISISDVKDSNGKLSVWMPKKLPVFKV